MRSALLVIVTSLVIGGPRSAGADDRENAVALSKEGLKLARAKQFAEAIAKFKEADRLAPSAANDCNIALSYYRLDRYDRAELFIQRCKRRWVREKTTGLPAWVAKGHGDITKKLEGRPYASLAVSTTPTGARISARGWDAGEWIEAPATIWLPSGETTITAERDGFESNTRTLTLKAGAPMALALKLARPEKPAPEPTPTLEPTPTPTPTLEPEPTPTATLTPTPTPETDSAPRSTRTTAWVVTASGAALLAGGGLFHVVALGKKSDAEKLGPGSEFDDLDSQFGTFRAAAVGLYAAGAVVSGIGVYLLVRSPGAPTAHVSASQDGAAASLRWTFD